jgi:4'-phosphopantetheinyl transferase
MRTAVALWNAAPAGLKPESGEVNVFSAPLDVPTARFDELAQWLADDEWQRAKRFHLKRDRSRFIVGRGQLREILGALLDIHPKKFVFSCGEFGKPQIAGPVAAHSLHFNLAHSDSLAVYATAKHELGVDLERVRAMDQTEQIAARFFSTHEGRCLAVLPAEQRLEAFFSCWTRKEAYIKAIGLGLSDCLVQIEVSFTPLGAAEWLGVPRNPPRWFLHSFSPAADFVGALALPQQDSQVHCWQWNGLP